MLIVPRQIACWYLCLGLLFVTACTTTPPAATSDRGATLRAEHEALLSLVAGWLPGEYGNLAQSRAQEVDHVLLGVRPETDMSSLAAPLTLVFEQTDAGGNTRRQRYRLRADQTGVWLNFAPWRPDGSGFIDGCEMRLLPTADGLGVAGESQPEQCRFSTASGSTALLKEVGIGPGRVDIAERLLDAQGGVLSERRLHFKPMLRFRGWAGVRPQGSRDDQQWRVADAFELHTEGDRIPLQDAAGDSLGYVLRLARTPYRRDQPDILRLELLDGDSGELLAYAFADPRAEQIGLNLGWFQAGLKRVR